MLNIIYIYLPSYFIIPAYNTCIIILYYNMYINILYRYTYLLVSDFITYLRTYIDVF